MIGDLAFEETLITASCRLNFSINDDRALFECCSVSSDILCIKCRDKIAIYEGFRLRKKKKIPKLNVKQQWNTLNKSVFFKISIPGTSRAPIIKLFKNGVVQVNGIKNRGELAPDGLWSRRFAWFLEYLTACVSKNPSVVEMAGASPVAVLSPFAINMINFRTTTHPLSLVAVKNAVKEHALARMQNHCPAGECTVCTYGIDNRAILIVRVVTPNPLNPRKITCLSITALGKINVQGSVDTTYMQEISRFISKITH